MYENLGVFIIGLKITEPLGNRVNETLQVTTTNIAPAVILSSPASVDKGTTQTYSFTVTDLGGDRFSVRAGSLGCGIGGCFEVGSLTTDVSGGSFQCAFLDISASLSVMGSPVPSTSPEHIEFGAADGIRTRDTLFGRYPAVGAMC